jgi:hypothetical protein
MRFARFGCCHSQTKIENIGMNEGGRWRRQAWWRCTVHAGGGVVVVVVDGADGVIAQLVGATAAISTPSLTAGKQTHL